MRIEEHKLKMKLALALFYFFLLFAAVGQVFSEETQPVSENLFESPTEKPPAGTGENNADQVIIAQSDKWSVVGSIIKTAEKIETTTNLASITCGIGYTGGLAAIPCLAVQSVNFTSGLIGWFFRRVSIESPDASDDNGQSSEQQIYNDPL